MMKRLRGISSSKNFKERLIERVKENGNHSEGGMRANVNGGGGCYNLYIYITLERDVPWRLGVERMES